MMFYDVGPTNRSDVGKTCAGFTWSSVGPEMDSEKIDMCLVWDE